MENVPNHQPASMVLVKGPSPPSVPSRPAAFAPVAAAGAVGTAPGVSPRPSCAGRSQPRCQQWIGLRENLHQPQGFYHHFFWKPRVFTIIFFGGVPVNLKPSSDKKLKQSIGKWLEDRLEIFEDDRKMMESHGN